MLERQFDSAVVEALALAYGLDIASEMKTRTERFTGALVVVDNTCVAAAVLVGSELPPRLRHAVAHVLRNASKVLQAGWSVKQLNKSFSESNLLSLTPGEEKNGGRRTWRQSVAVLTCRHTMSRRK